MANQGDLSLWIERVDQLAEVEDVIGNRIGAADRPIRVAVSTQIERNYVKVSSQVERHKIPSPRMIASAMDQDGERLARVTPIDIVELEPLRIKEMRSGSDYIRHATASGIRAWASFLIGVQSRLIRMLPTPNLADQGFRA